jgi:hypothetical protein
VKYFLDLFRGPQSFGSGAFAVCGTFRGPFWKIRAVKNILSYLYVLLSFTIFFGAFSGGGSRISSHFTNGGGGGNAGAYAPDPTRGSAPGARKR